MTINRAYSLLEIKSVDSELRIVRGTATTPTTDRMGDIVEPEGVQFKNPMPLLWQHKSDKPVGEVRFKKPTKDGIDFEARIAKSEGVSSASLRDRLDEAWESVKLGLVKAVSIGFRALEYSFMKESDGIHFTETEVMELSLVTIPANADAVISELKSIDSQLVAASGIVLKGCERPVKPGVTGQPKILPKEKTVKTIKERIAAFEADRAAKSARMEALMTPADGDELATLDKEQSEEYDTLRQDVAAIDAHLARMWDLDKANRKELVPVTPAKTEIVLPDGGNSGQAMPISNSRVVVKGPAAPPGTGFLRLCIATMYGKGDTMRAISRAKEWANDFPQIIPILEAGIPNLMAGQDGNSMQKAAVAVGTTLDGVFASPLINYNILVDEWVQLLRPLTIIGRIPGLRRVPFNIQLPSTTTGSTVNWVGEGAPKPVSALALATVTLRWAKAAGIVVLTEELVRFSNPAAESFVRDDLVKAMTAFLDVKFVDPTVAEVTNVSPASITNGVTAVTPTGTNEAAFRVDVRTLLNTFLTNNLQVGGGVWIMTQQQKLAFTLMVNALGQPSFPSVPNGTLLGYPIVDSEGIPATGGSPTDGYPLIFCIPSEIMLADDGQTVVDASNQASVQMDSAPDSPPSSSTNLISLWQLNMVGLRAERWINWKKRRSTAVGYISNAKYA